MFISTTSCFVSIALVRFFFNIVLLSITALEGASSRSEPRYSLNKKAEESDDKKKSNPFIL
jgi:hypothetical protein